MLDSRVGLKRRKFLQYVGAGAVSIFLDERALAAPTSSALPVVPKPGFLTDFQAVPSCIPLPGDGVSAIEDEIRFQQFTVKDELTIPANYVAKQLVAWGDVLGSPGHSIRVGYNCDHLSLIKHSKSNEYFLIINHEYVSHRPWSESVKNVVGKDSPQLELFAGEDFLKLKEGDLIVPLFSNSSLLPYPDLIKKIQTLAQQTLREMGVSILHLQCLNGELSIIKDSPLHRRISTVERENISPETKFSFRGPGSHFLPPPCGTMANCSGATTPWNTALTCEENIQSVAPEWVTPSGAELDQSKFLLSGLLGEGPSGIPIEWTGLGTCIENPLDNRTYGWVGEVIAETGELKKFTALGRFRHENVTINATVGQTLKLYMGDDRRGGHIWRFESSQIITDPTKRSTANLLEEGELCCANFNQDFSGNWIPLNTKTPLIVPKPDEVAEKYLFLPYRPDGGPVVVTNRDKKEVMSLIRSSYRIFTPFQWVKSVEEFCKKPFAQIRLGDLVIGETEEQKQLVILMDAFLMANAVGGTPTARPEDLEVHPLDQSVYIAFTDNTGKEQGSPKVSIFPDSHLTNSKQYGAIYRIEEKPNRQFSWGKFLSSGEIADSGAGFASVDNLAFDRAGNLWFVCDISVESLNHTVEGGPRENPGEKYFPGIFGNSSLFVVPTSGVSKGIPRLFATGPMESELTGIKFYEDENLNEFLLLSVQHPGEVNGVGKGKTEERTIQMRTRTGKKFKQTRKVPIGSNFPDGKGSPPKPTVFAIYRN